MKVSLEILAHCNCDRCGKWWSIADRPPVLGQTLYCPDCGHSNTAIEILNGKGQQVASVAWLLPAVVRPAIVLDSDND